MAKPLTQTNLDNVTRKLGLMVQKARVEIRIGVPDVVHHSGFRMPELALIHEFGTRDGHIPERAPFRTSIRENARKYVRLLRVAAKAALDKQRNAYERVGAVAASDVQRTIARGLPPPNAASTIAAKGSSKPLIDTGAFRQSVTWEIRDAQ